MSRNITIARPYAKAIFDLAKRDKSLNEWCDLLRCLSHIINKDNISKFLKNKTISHYKKSHAIINFLDFNFFLNKSVKQLYINFINTLAYYNRLLYLKDIFILYKRYLNLELGYIDVFIKTACVINNVQKNNIINRLSKRFNKKILATFETDMSLLGGFLIKVDDFVLDASIAGNLISLRINIMI